MQQQAQLFSIITHKIAIPRVSKSMIIIIKVITTNEYTLINQGPEILKQTPNITFDGPKKRPKELVWARI